MDQTKNPRFNERKGKKVSFIDFLSKIKISPERRLKKRKRIKLGKEGDTILAAAEWVDEELKENIKKREKLSRGWRIARNRGEPPEILEKYEKAYKEQQVQPSIMSGNKKGERETSKNNRNQKKRMGRSFGT